MNIVDTVKVCSLVREYETCTKTVTCMLQCMLTAFMILVNSYNILGLLARSRFSVASNPMVIYFGFGSARI